MNEPTKPTGPDEGTGGLPMKTCTKCGEVQSINAFSRNKNKPSGFATWCKACLNAHNRARYHADPESQTARTKRYLLRNPAARMVTMARYRAKRDGLPFSITEADVIVPEKCPVLGVQLFREKGQAGPFSPSLDKIVPSLGYVPGNVRVISNRANTLKRDATLEEIEALADWMRRLVAPVSTSRRKANPA